MAVFDEKMLNYIGKSYKEICYSEKSRKMNFYAEAKPIIYYVNGRQYGKMVAVFKQYERYKIMAQSLREQILRTMAAERERQISIYGLQEDLNPVERLAILSEEFGEVSKEANDIYFKLTKLNDEEFNEVEENLMTELVQVGAVCLSWLEALHIERNKRVKNK